MGRNLGNSVSLTLAPAAAPIENQAKAFVDVGLTAEIASFGGRALLRAQVVQRADTPEPSASLEYQARWNLVPFFWNVDFSGALLGGKRDAGTGQPSRWNFRAPLPAPGKPFDPSFETRMQLYLRGGAEFSGH